MVAFLYGWCLLLVVQTGGMAAVAVTLAHYVVEMTGIAWTPSAIAVVTLVALGAINIAVVCGQFDPERSDDFEEFSDCRARGGIFVPAHPQAGTGHIVSISPNTSSTERFGVKLMDALRWPDVRRVKTNVTGLVKQELLLENEYLAAENRIHSVRLPLAATNTNPTSSLFGQVTHTVAPEQRIFTVGARLIW